MTRTIHPWLLGLVAATLAACHSPQAAPDARDNPHVTAAIEEEAPSLADAARATYWGGQARQITLDNGGFEGPEGQRVELLRQHYATGDLEGDGAVDAVVALSVTNAGDETGHYLAVLRHLGMDTISLGTAFLGHPVEVERVHVEGRRVIVDLKRRSATDPECCPSEPARVVFVLGRGELVKVDDTSTTR
jgi:hypothetical protein